MEKISDKDKMKAEESAPMPTKGRKDAEFRNQSTEVPQNRFPWTTIAMVIAFIILVAVVVTVLSLGSS